MKTDSDILTSRLLVPRHTDVLIRPRIDAKISRIQNIKLLMVTAGAGYGKTIAVSSLINTLDAACAWYRITTRETDCLTFIRYLICAIRMHYGSFCRQPVEDHFQYGGMPAVCSYVAKELESRVARDFFIVLDDWHLVRGTHQIIDFVAFLIDNTHDNVHFILNSRATPNLPVAKLIASGDAEEITEADLRFNREEAAFSSWCAAIRDAFRERYLNLLQAVIEVYESMEAYATCIDYSNRYLEKEMYNEVVYQKQMLYYARLGRKDMIRNVFERCKQSIAGDLGCPLNPKTVDLFRDLAG